MNPDTLAIPLARGLDALRLELPDANREALLAYIRLLTKWNAAYNLTAVREPAQMLSRHVLDSLTILPYLHREGPVLDVGSGAGLPGIPLALARPERRFVLLDSNGKKTRFLVQAVAELGLKNTEVVQARVEDYRATGLFANVVSRAFAALGDFLGQSAHLGGKDSRWLAMKAEPSAQELAAVPAGFQVVAVHPLTVPELAARRCLVEISRR